MDKLQQKIKEGNKPPKRASWWSRNGYYVWRVILFPIYLIIIADRAYEDWQVRRQKLDKAKTDKILTAWLVKHGEVDEGCLWFSPDWNYFSIRLDGWLGWKYKYYLHAFKYILYSELVKSWTPPMFARTEEKDQYGDRWVKFIPERIN